MSMARPRRRGMTLIEVMFASVLGLLVASAVMSLFLLAARQTRVNLASEVARRRAGRVLDTIAGEIRRASVDNPVSFPAGSELGSGEFAYSAVQFQRHGVLAQFRLDNGAVLFDPDIATAGDEQILAGDSQSMPHFTSLRFLQNFNGVVEDNTTLGIELTVSDEGSTRSSWASAAGPVQFTLSTFLTLRAPG